MDTLKKQYFGLDAGARLDRLGSAFCIAVSLIALIRFSNGRGLTKVIPQVILLQVALAFLRPFDDRSERRIRQNEIELALGETGILVMEFRKKIERVVAHDIGVAVIVDDHIHLGDASEFLVHLDAEQLLLREVVPVGKMFQTLTRVG